MTCCSPDIKTLILVLLMLLAAMPAGAKVGLFGTWSYTGTESSVEEKQTQIKTRGESERFRQSYRLDISKNLYPTLNLRGGVQVEQERFIVTSSGSEIESREQEIRPFADVDLSGRNYSLTAGYQEREVRSRGTLISDDQFDFLDNFNLRAIFRPFELPSVDISYFNSKRYDDPLTLDQETDTWQLNSHYAVRNYRFFYDYLHSDQQNRLQGVATLSEVHSAQARYQNNFRDGRVSLNGRLRAEYSSQDFTGGSLRDFAVFPSGNSFYYIDSDTDPNNNLPGDYIQTPVFGTNLNLNSTDILDIGLAFGEPVVVDMLQLPLGAELDVGSLIPAAGNWAVYASDDQENWQSLGIAGIAYDAEEVLLEIRLATSANDDFIMIVYDPPLNTNQVGPVYVTAIRAFESRFLDSGSKLVTRTHDARLGVSWAIAEPTNLNYNLNIQERRTDLFDEQNLRLSNGFNLSHRFSDIFSGATQLYLVETWENSNHDTSTYSFSARLAGDYLESLRQSLVFSSNLSRDTNGDSLQNSVILRTNAMLYEGWEVIFDQGFFWQESDDSDDSETLFLGFDTSVTPHPRLRFFLDYNISWHDSTSTPTRRQETGRARLSWVPLDTISLSATLRLFRDEEETDTSWEYSISWLPLRDGDLQLSLSWYEKENPNGDRTRNASSNISWAVARKATLNLNYSVAEVDTERDITTSETFQATFRIYFN